MLSVLTHIQNNCVSKCVKAKSKPLLFADTTILSIDCITLMYLKQRSLKGYLKRKTFKDIGIMLSKEKMTTFVREKLFVFYPFHYSAIRTVTLRCSFIFVIGLPSCLLGGQSRPQDDASDARPSIAQLVDRSFTNFDF